MRFCKLINELNLQFQSEDEEQKLLQFSKKVVINMQKINPSLASQIFNLIVGSGASKGGTF